MRRQEFRLTRKLWGALGVCVVLSMACLVGGEEVDDEPSGPTQACFVHCQGAFGVSSACFSSSSDYESDSECSSKATDYCGGSGVNRSEQVSECNCSASCEPQWYSE